MLVPLKADPLIVSTFSGIVRVPVNELQPSKVLISIVVRFSDNVNVPSKPLH